MRFRCNMPTCGKFPKGFEFEDNAGVCPKCKASGPMHIAALADVHFMVMDHMGPIHSMHGRQFVACQPKREHLALHPMVSNEFFSASGEVANVTCPACKKTESYRQAAQGYDELMQALALTSGRLIVDLKN